MRVREVVAAMYGKVRPRVRLGRWMEQVRRARRVRGIERVALATALAIALAGPLAWGHTFPPVHTVVVQVERCEVALLVGYVAGTGEPTERIVARVASQPKSHVLDALRDTLTAYAMAPIVVAIDRTPVAPTSVRAKIGFDASGTRPMVVVLATYPLRGGGELAIRSKDPRTTRISWQDRASGRVDRERAPAQDHWFTGVASFLLSLAATPGGSSCALIGSADSSGDSLPASSR
ncbi:MAG TPA: hypothetical protein VHN14_34665 [Kofleriaceae bacterium]|jgi:hypothetical protein|nr:hypothetical protein [Kofleriaceae bacterium]